MVQEVQVVVIGVVAAASDRAGRGAHPLEPVGVGDVIGVAGVLLRSQDCHFLKGRGRKALYLPRRGRSPRPRRPDTKPCDNTAGYDRQSDIAGLQTTGQTSWRTNISPGEAGKY